VLIFTHGLNLGVDFVGGQMIRVTFTQSASAPSAQLRSEVEALGFGEPIIQTFGAPNECRSACACPKARTRTPPPPRPWPRPSPPR
jgi:preprotein translocase subunit SecF